jgi:CHAT domain-containing protein
MSYIWVILNNGYLISAQLGLLWGIALFARAFVVLRQHRALFTPMDYVEEQVAAHPVGPSGIGPDPGWPVYTYRQASIDVVTVRKAVGRLNRVMWRWPSDTFFRGRHGPRWAWWIFLFPVCVTVLYFVACSFLASWFSYWTYWAIIFSSRLADRTVIASLRSWLRSREERRRVTMHTDAACMNCLHVTSWPAYACPGCGRLHHDVSPGDLGTFYRKCLCGNKFPTLPSRAAWRMRAVCMRCGYPLPEGTGAVRDIRVPVFGDTAAGKTRFLYASLNSLLLDLDRARIRYDYLDNPSQVEAELRLKDILANEDVSKTLEAPATAISLRLREGRHSNLIHLFDAAGEQYSRPENWDFELIDTETNRGSLRFLEDGQALAYVLDPFSVDLIRGQVAAHDRTLIAQAHAARQDPEISYAEVVNRLRGLGVPIQAQRLAVVVSKADLLRTAGIDVPSDSGAIAEWLSANGVHNLVMAAPREFAEVRFFAVASMDVSASRTDDPGVPLRWLLATHGVRLPARAVAQSRHVPLSDREAADPEPLPVAVGHGVTAERSLQTCESASMSSGRLGRAKTGATAAPGAGGAGEPDEGNSSRGGGDSGAGIPQLPQPPRYLIGDLPERASTERRISLFVWISRTVDGVKAVPLERLSLPAAGSRVTITVSAPNLVPLRDLKQDVHVPATDDSEPVRFSFMTGRAGLHTVLVRAFAGGTFLAELSIQISVEVGVALEKGPSRAVPLPGLAAEPGEVTLQVSRTGDRYSFQLFAETLYPVEQTRRLAGDPTNVVNALISELRTIAAGRSSYTSAESVRKRIRNLGAQLWADVVPEAIQRQFWEQADRIKLFTVASDMDTVPWELLYPVDRGHDNGFLVEQFPVVRRAYGQNRIRQLQLSSAAYIVPPGSPVDALDEVSAVRSKLGAGVLDHGVTAQYDSVIELLNDVPSVLHFAGHNTFNDDQGSLVALDGGPLRPSDLTIALKTCALAPASPLVFFNACRTAGEIPGMTQMIGWAKQFMGAGAGAFVGSLWDIRSSAAQAFAEAFYHALITDHATLGEASLKARQAIRDETGDPTWLAYTIYGNPSATISAAHT